MWSDERIEKACFAEFLSYGHRLMEVEKAADLLRQMREEYEAKVDGVRLVAAQMVAAERSVQDALNLALTEVQPALALVELLKVGNFHLTAGVYRLHFVHVELWVVTQIRPAHKTVYTGDLAGALVVLREAAGVGDAT